MPHHIIDFDAAMATLCSHGGSMGADEHALIDCYVFIGLCFVSIAFKANWFALQVLHAAAQPPFTFFKVFTGLRVGIPACVGN